MAAQSALGQTAGAFFCRSLSRAAGGARVALAETVRLRALHAGQPQSARDTPGAQAYFILERAKIAKAARERHVQFPSKGSHLGRVVDNFLHILQWRRLGVVSVAPAQSRRLCHHVFGCHSRNSCFSKRTFPSW